MLRWLLLVTISLSGAGAAALLSRRQARWIYSVIRVAEGGGAAECRGGLDESTGGPLGSGGGATPIGGGSSDCQSSERPTSDRPTSDCPTSDYSTAHHPQSGGILPFRSLRFAELRWIAFVVLVRGAPQQAGDSLLAYLSGSALEDQLEDNIRSTNAVSIGLRGVAALIGGITLLYVHAKVRALPRESVSVPSTVSSKDSSKDSSADSSTVSATVSSLSSSVSSVSSSRSMRRALPLLFGQIASLGISGALLAISTRNGGTQLLLTALGVLALLPYTPLDRRLGPIHRISEPIFSHISRPIFLVPYFFAPDPIFLRVASYIPTKPI